MPLERHCSGNPVINRHGKLTMGTRSDNRFMQVRSGRPVQRDRWVQTLTILILLSCALGVSGCGKKGPPVAPQEKPIPAVNDLNGHRQADRVVLSWHLPAGLNHRTVPLEGFRVYRSKQPLDMERCQGCPLIFERVAFIPFDGTQTNGPGTAPIQYAETIEKGHRYIYKVVGLRSKAAESGSSNLVEIVY